MRRRAWSLLAAVAVAASSAVVVAPKAYACSCGNAGPDAAVATGGAVGVVTRLDDGETTEAEFAVEETYGSPMPPRVGGRVDDGGSCYPFVEPGATVALIFERRLSDLAWRASFCGNVPLGETFLRTRGLPLPESSGPVVAIATGGFGGAGIVSIDAAGRPVAWGEATGDTVTACPGGRTVVLQARDFDHDQDPILRVVDVASLEPTRTVALPKDFSYFTALRCRDESADAIDVLAYDYRGNDTGVPARLAVAGTDIERTDFPGLRAVAPAPPRFGSGALLATTVGREAKLVLVRGDGTRRTLVAHTGLREASLLPAPDGRTVLLSGTRSRTKSERLLRVFDLPSGRLVGSRGGELGAPLWIDGRLVARTEAGYLRPHTSIEVFDRRLRHVATSPAPEGYGFAASGSDVVGFAATRLALATPGRPRQAVEFGSLRLAAASDVALLPGARFAPPAGVPKSG